MPAVSATRLAVPPRANDGTNAGCRCEEILELAGELGVVNVDGCLEDCDVAIPVGHVFPSVGQAIEPVHVRRARPHRFRVDQMQQKRAVGRAPSDHGSALSQRLPQGRQGIVPVPATGDELGEHGIEFRGDFVSFGDAGVETEVRACGDPQELYLTGRRREALLASSAFNRTSMAWPWTVGGGPSSFPPRAM